MLKITPNGMGLKLFILASCYVSQAFPIGFCWVGLPVIFRKTGADLETIGWLSMLYLPWALKFLWSPYVDRYYSAEFGRRRSWILPLQWLAGVALIGLAYFPPMIWPLAGFSLMLVLNFFYATNDIATDAYATDILKPTERSLGNSVQMGAAYLGHMLGGGACVILYGYAGWQWTLFGMAAMTFVLSLPMLFHKEIKCFAKAVTESDSENSLKLWSVIKASSTRRVFLWLVFVGLITYGNMHMLFPLLSDLGFSSQKIGSLLFLYGYPFGILGALSSGFLIRLFGVRFLLYTGGILGSFVAIVTIHLLSLSIYPEWEIALLIATQQVLFGYMQVLAYTVIMEKSASKNSATHFAIFCSAFHIIFFCQGPLLGYLAEQMGYAGLYKYLAFVFLVSCFFADKVMKGFSKKSGLSENKNHLPLAETK